MLIQPEKNKLGSQRVYDKEAVAKLTEECLDAAAVFKIGGQAELADAERACGPRLYFKEIIRRLEKCNPSLFFREGSKGNIAVYRLKRLHEQKADEWDPAAPDWYNDHKYVTGFPKDYIPEYSYLILDSSNLPVRELRGWRSILLALIKSGAISYQSTLEQFGKAKGQRSTRWYEQLQNL